MKICFVVDARSPIASNWIRHFIAGRHEVQIISTYPCPQAMYAGVTMHEAPVALAGFSRASQSQGKFAAMTDAPRASLLTDLKGRVVAQLSLAVQHGIMPLDLPRQARGVRRLLAHLAPDVIHAMRIPFEGILAAQAARPDVPLLISVWGNDFTLWASRNPLIARQTRRALRRADSLHTDCQRDLRMAIRDWGFKADKPAVVLPGAGGIQTTRFHPGTADAALRQQLNIAEDAQVVINPRGMRGYVCNEAFFQAIPQVLRARPQTIFLCSAMQGHAVAEKWVNTLKLQASVRLLPPVARDQMAEMFRLAAVAVSPSLHDGTPNTLLEAMASGCLPVAGDIESVREWVTDEVNGLLCDPTSPDQLARAMIRALEDESLQNAARGQNLRLIAERAEYNQVMRQAEAFYEELVQRKARGF